MVNELYDLIKLRPKKYLAVIYLMTSVAAVIEMLGALFAGYSVIAGGEFGLYFSLSDKNDYVILLGVIIICILTLLLRVAAVHYEKYYANLYRLEMSKEIVQSLWRGPYSSLSKKNNSELVKSLTTDIDMIVSYAVDPIITVGSAITSSVIITIMLMFYDPFATVLAFLGVTIVFGFLSIVSKGRLQHYGKNAELMLRKRQLISQHIFSDVRAFKSRPLDNNTIDKLSLVNAQFTWYASVSHNISQFPRFLLETAILGFLVFTTLTYEGATSGVTLSGLIVYGVAGLRLLPTAQRMFTAYANLNYSRKFLSDFTEMTKVKSRDDFSQQHLCCSSIVCKNCEIQKPDGTSLFAEQFEISVGQMIAITGASGTGKTTFVDTLIGLNSDFKGSILLDGKEAYEGELISSSYLTQKPNLPMGTIEEIFYDCDDINKIETSLDQLDLTHMNRDTYVGEFARNISGGELQRLAVIKSVTTPCSLRVFDESFNAVSENMREKIFNYIKNKTKNEMVIIITHDHDIAKLCDVTYHIESNILTNLTMK
ncbi:ABC transporter ATP-binding protein/permease [Amylibacter sp.]|nr:ABC transporter ATP-binding protein/permease [Amylibacter sp.]